MNLTQKQIAELHEGSVTPHGYINEPDYRSTKISKMRKRQMRLKQEHEHKTEREQKCLQQ